MSVLDQPIETLRATLAKEVVGRVSEVRGLTVRAIGLPFPVGGLVRLEPRAMGAAPATGEVVGCDRDGSIIMLYTQSHGLAPGNRVVGLQTAPTVPVSFSMLGRVINGFGLPIDSGGAIYDAVAYPVMPNPMTALEREPIRTALATGIKAIDCLTTTGRGQRLGIFSGPGVGKSTLLASIAKHTGSDVNVIGLIGERGREVQDFIEHGLGAEGLARSVVVVSTSDESPLLRLRAAMVATTIAEYFRDQKKDVVLMMDSLTRFCQAQRQIGLAAGEPPATKGYTPSVFAQLAQLLERAGNKKNSGSITGFYTVLVEGDDMTEPISDASRAILDGHISLSRTLANRGHYPAIDVLDSVSRVADDVTSDHHSQSRRQLVRLMSLYGEIEELVNIGAYVSGSSAEYDVAIEAKPRIEELLRQNVSEHWEFEESESEMIRLALETGHALSNRMSNPRAASENPM